MKITSVVVLAIVILTTAGNAQDRVLLQPAELTTGETPVWLKAYRFGQQQFTFVRIKYTSRAIGRRTSQDWRTDHPNADERLASLIRTKTSLATDHKVLELTSDDLLNHKLIYIVEPGLMQLTNAEVGALQRYLKNGGLLVLDDSFGDDQYENIQSELKRVCPSKQLEEVPLDHPIFHCVFNFTERPQVRSENVDSIQDWRKMVGSVAYRCIKDENGQIVVLVCHNTDLGDGWARLGDDSAYAKDYADKCAGPFGLNLVFHALTK
ncbi:DUF4159 domain-containing protein [Pirellulaceae bacterium SH501]